MSSKFKIGILLAGHSPDEITNKFGSYDILFHKLLDDDALEFKTYKVVDMEFPKNIDECDGWLITGSRHGVYEELEFIAPLEAFTRNAYENNKPLVGICFGHQLIAQALGGKVEKFHDGWNIGLRVYESDDNNYQLLAWHQDQIIEKPDNAELIATHNKCKYASLLYENKAFTMQPHPEFGNDYFQSLFKARKEILPQSVIDDVEQNSISKLDSKYAAEQIKNFFIYRSIYKPNK